MNRLVNLVSPHLHNLFRSSVPGWARRLGPFTYFSIMSVISRRQCVHTHTTFYSVAKAFVSISQPALVRRLDCAGPRGDDVHIVSKVRYC